MPRRPRNGGVRRFRGGPGSFYATINGANETPPNASPAIGRGWFNFDRASSTIWYKVESNVAVGTASHIHKGAPGVAGPIIFPLVGGPANYEGVTPALTPAQIQDLYNGQYYVNIHSVAFPGGEIRGQLTKVFTRRTFASLSGLSEVPPTPSAGAGTATVILHEPSHVITYQMKVGGLTSMPTGAHIHTGPVGVNGPITVILNGGATSATSGEWCGTAQLSAADASLLITSGMYVNVHTVIFAGGEVRGQLMPQKRSLPLR